MGAADVGKSKGWRSQVTVALIGATGAMTVNIYTGTGYRGLALLLAATGASLAVTWIPQLCPGARLSLRAPQLFWIAAIAAELAAAFSPRPIALAFALITMTLAAGAVLLAKDNETAAIILSSAALMGFGISWVEVGTLLSDHRHFPADSAFICLGLAFMAIATALLNERQGPLGAAVISLGLAFAGLGEVLWLGRHALDSAVLMGIGAACIVFGGALIADREAAACATIVLGGAMIIWTGLTLATDQEPMAGSALVGLGLVIIVTGVAHLTGRHVLGYAITIASGTLVAGSGATSHVAKQPLILAAIILGSVAMMWCGAAEIGSSKIMPALRQLYDYWTNPPQT